MSSARTVILDWLKKNALVLRYREEEHVLYLQEIQSGKTLRLHLQDIASYRLMPHPQGFSNYLNIVLQGGFEIVLCHAGIAFQPAFHSTGPLPDAPAVSCLMDYFSLRSTLGGLIHEKRKQEAITLFNVLISILDGARAVGLNIDDEEKELDGLLSEFEKSLQ